LQYASQKTDFLGLKWDSDFIIGTLPSFGRYLNLISHIVGNFMQLNRYQEYLYSIPTFLDKEC